MKTPMICLTMLAALVAPAAADTHYDRKLEKAVIEIVAGKIGTLRGGFAYDVKPLYISQFATPESAAPDPIVTRSIFPRHPVAGDGKGGPMFADERKVSRVITF